MTLSQGSGGQGAKASAKEPKGFPVGTKVVVDESGLTALLGILTKIGYTPIGPRVRDGAVVYEEITSVSDMPIGVSDEQEGGKYRLTKGTKGALFEYTCGPASWKRYLYPPSHKIWDAERKGNGFTINEPVPDAPSYAFIGVRSCELNAMKIQDKVFGFGREDKHHKGIFSDPGYIARRSKALIIAVNCSRSGNNCFCVSMGGDPHLKEGQGFDLALTELIQGSRHEFVVEVGSERGGLILELLPHREARTSEIHDVEAQARKARGEQTKKMIPDVKDVLPRNLRHPRWDDVAERCMSCTNCTMVCPTCFCTTVEDSTNLKGDKTERTRSWDSCFSVDFSYIHGGAIRRENKSRYRQWLTHKLASWHDQYGTSGCVGCGRCITWCPVGIDITVEAKAIKETSGKIASDM